MTSNTTADATSDHAEDAPLVRGESLRRRLERVLRLADRHERTARPIVLLRDLDHRARRPLQRGQVLRGWDLCQRRRRQTQQENPTSDAHDYTGNLRSLTPGSPPFEKTIPASSKAF